jgi:hypothetical protein
MEHRAKGKDFSLLSVYFPLVLTKFNRVPKENSFHGAIGAMVFCVLQDNRIVFYM